MLQKGLQEVAAGRIRCRYERLVCDNYQNEDIHVAAVRPASRSSSSSRRRPCCWVKKMNGRLLIKGLRLSRLRSRKLTLKALSSMVSLGKIMRMYGDVIERMKKDGMCPNFVFSAGWGLPVLSHPPLKSKSRSLHNITT